MSKITINDRYMAIADAKGPGPNLTSLLPPAHSLKLTRCAWLTYAWLLQHSKYNVNDAENHYYIYNNAYTNGDIADATGYRADSVSAAKRELINAGLLEKTKTGGKIVWIITADPRNFAMAAMPLKVLDFFLTLKDSIFPYKDTLMRTYGILKLAKRGGADSYSVSALMAVLRKDRHKMESRLEVMSCLGLLKELGLLSTIEYPYTNAKGRKCISYKIVSIGGSIENVMAHLEDDDADELMSKVTAGARVQLALDSVEE